MISNFNSNKISRKKFYAVVISVFLFIVWLCTPPGNKFAQMCFLGNNIRLFTAKITHNTETKEWLIYRNNAVYQLRMNKNEDAIKEMDKAIDALPVYMDNRLSSLYKDRALLRIYNEDYKGALSDYMKADNYSMSDNLKIAMLYNEIGKRKLAVSYCNQVLDFDVNAYAGYACLAKVYSDAARYDVAVRIFDLLISRSPNNALYYLDRAEYKMKLGDRDGYNEDVKKANSLNSLVSKNATLIKDTLHPKIQDFKIIKG